MLENKRKLKILYILQFFIPAWRFGGVVQLAYNIAKGMVQMGHEVTVFATDAFEPGRRIEEKTSIINGINVIYFKNLSNYLASKYRILQPKILRRQLKNHIKDYDIVHILDMYSISTYWAYRYAKKNEIPLFITTSGLFSEYSQKSKGFLKKIVNLLLKKVLQNSNGIIAQTMNEKKDLERFGLKNLKLIGIGINIKDFINLPSKNIFRKKFNIKDDQIIILFLGRVDKVKGIEYLVEAMHKIKHPNVMLFIIGPRTNYLNYILRIIKKYNLKDHIKVLNGLFDRAKMEAYMGADIYCLPSLYDCAPNTILEACACELPIITTSANGLNEIAEKGAGIVVEPKNSEALKDAILKLIKDKDNMIKMGKKGREVIQRNYEWRSKLKELEQLYYSNLKKK